MTVMGLTMTAGGIYIALTIFFNVFGTYLARVYAFENKAIFNAPENKIEEVKEDLIELEEVKEIKITNKKNKK